MTNTETDEVRHAPIRSKEKGIACLHHFALCPFSRKVRLLLHEKGVKFSLQQERFWRPNQALLALNAAGKIPVWVEQNGFVISDSSAIAEYLEEQYPDPPLFPADIYVRAEIRRLSCYVDERFWHDVTCPILEEKAIKGRHDGGVLSPRSERLRHAVKKLRHHCSYFTWLLQQREWLAGPERSLADYTLAAHISVLDFLNSMIWTKREELSHWYTRMKSRASFRYLLADHIPGHTPPPHYQDPDFT